jgi:hypothetical protein
MQALESLPFSSNYLGIDDRILKTEQIFQLLFAKSRNVQGDNASGLGRKDTQAHKRGKMGTLDRGGHPKSYDMQCLISQRAKPS